MRRKHILCVQVNSGMEKASPGEGYRSEHAELGSMDLHVEQSAGWAPGMDPVTDPGADKKKN